ncbi:MAG: sugar phosphate isomerase/epimerase [Clostridia bacterium]
MLIPGLVSITFRQLSPDEIIRLVDEAGLDAIEWGGDIHVPHGHIRQAQHVYENCYIHHIACPSYGSYYRVGESADPRESFGEVLSCAIALKANTVRVWAGSRAPMDTDCESRRKIVNETRLICKMAKEHGISISCEYHRNTLTEGILPTLELLDEINMDNLRTYWQPEVGMSYVDNISVIQKILPHASNIHVFQWDHTTRLPLLEGKGQWSDYLRLFNDSERYALLEFVRNDDPFQFLEDANTLKEMIHEIQSP